MKVQVTLRARRGRVDPAVRAHRRHREGSVPHRRRDVPRRAADAEGREEVRGRGRHHRHRHVAGRPSSHGRPDHADRGGGEAGDRRRRARAVGHRRSLDLPGARDRRGHVGGRHHRRRGGDAPPAAVDQQRHRAPRPGRLGHRRDARGRGRAVQPRALLPHGLGGDVRGQGTRGDERARQHRDARAAEVAPHGRRHAMAHAVRRVVGEQLDRHAGERALRPLRHHQGDAGLDRAERAQERGPHAVGDLQGSAHDGRLPERAHDHDAVRALRLRRAVRRRRLRSSCRARTSPAT